jgi:hypothetical protein
VLIEGLPLDSSFAKATRGTHWGEQEYLLTDIANHARALIAITRDQWAKHPGPRPEYIEPPRTRDDIERELAEAEQAQRDREAMESTRVAWFANN